MTMEMRAELRYKAKLAEHAERFDEMSEFMKTIAQMAGELSVEERNYLSVAYKNAVGARRASWRVIASMATKQKTKGNDQQAELAGAYRAAIEEELNSICNEILSLLDNYLIKTATSAESKVFYYKMKGDYYRYISEFCSEEMKKEPTESAKLAYEEATRLATSELMATHPIRLGLALNFSVFYYEIVGQPAEACEMARQAFDDGITELDKVSEELYRDSTLIMQLLRDNLSLWTMDSANAEKEPASLSAAAPPSAVGSGSNDLQTAKAS